MVTVGPFIAEGIVQETSVEDWGLRVEVTLPDHTEAAGAPLQATCRLVPGSLHGKAGGVSHGGLWWIPGKGARVLVLFLGEGGPDGIPGNDMDNGFIIGGLTTTEATIPVGLGGQQLANDLFLFVGKSGVEYHDSYPDDRTVHVGGDATIVVDGLARVDAKGGADINVTGNADIDVSATATITANIAKIVSATVEIGAGVAHAIQKLVDERFLPIFNNHRHHAVYGGANKEVSLPIVGGTSGSPLEPLGGGTPAVGLVDTHTTTETKAS